MRIVVGGRLLAVLVVLVETSACAVDVEGECSDLCNGQGTASTSEGASEATDTDASTDASTTAAPTDSSGEADDGGGTPPLYDVDPSDLPADDTGPMGECSLEHTACDTDTNDPFAAMGVNCPGESQFTTSTRGPTGPYDWHGLGFEVPSGSIGVRSSFGGTDTFNPREGEAYAAIGSGLLADLDLEPMPEELEGAVACNKHLGFEYDPLMLPDPILSAAVDCEADPSLIGTGDCSGTLEEQFNQGYGWYNWSQLTLGGFVPDNATSFSFDFAFLTYEYPEYLGTQFNDMFVGWLESENWTGNISFDADGKPITLNASFLDFKDDDAIAPEFEDTCMQGHAATNWLSTSVGVTPGEYVRIAFAVFDSSDAALDSYAFVDNVSWGCDDIEGPVTEPAG